MENRFKQYLEDFVKNNKHLREDSDQLFYRADILSRRFQQTVLTCDDENRINCLYATEIGYNYCFVDYEDKPDRSPAERRFYERINASKSKHFIWGLTFDQYYALTNRLNQYTKKMRYRTLTEAEYKSFEDVSTDSLILRLMMQIKVK